MSVQKADDGAVFAGMRPFPRFLITYSLAFLVFSIIADLSPRFAPPKIAGHYGFPLVVTFLLWSMTCIQGLSRPRHPTSAPQQPGKVNGDGS
jgi:uncharacterized membrane protein